MAEEEYLKFGNKLQQIFQKIIFFLHLQFRYRQKKHEQRERKAQLPGFKLNLVPILTIFPENQQKKQLGAIKPLQKKRMQWR